MATPRAPGLKMPLQAEASSATALPAVLRTAGSRADGSDSEPLLPSLRLKRTLELAPASRSADAPASEVLDARAGLLALEAADGTTIFMRADALAEQLERARPELIDTDGLIDFARFRDSRDTTRGALGWVWRRVMELELVDDELNTEAKARARELLGQKIKDSAGEWAAAWASRKGAQALMETIESRLAGAPGLYHWSGGVLQDSDRCAADDPRLSAAKKAGTLLVFIHGTGSHTLGGFGDLPGSSAWGLLKAHFGDRVFGFEHRTFSESPIDNALALAETLPAGSQLCLVTHSRGGLVGDLMCLDPDDEMLDELIDAWRPAPRFDERGARTGARELAAVAAAEQAKLRRLAGLLRDKKLRVERYVRVAAPARGTALLSDNLDVFLSTLLNLVRRFGTWGAGTVAGVVASPLAVAAARKVADRSLAFLARVVLEIADKRLQPDLVPGIEAMLPESPMGMLLGRAALAPQVRMAIIAGDIEGAGAGLVQRIGVMFVDWAFFDRARNDLVVDTDSMYGGLIARAAAPETSPPPPPPRAIYVQGPEVSHFRYFRDDVKSAGISLPAALGAWLTHEAPEQAAPWQPLDLPELKPAAAGRASRGENEPVDNSVPVLIFLPGIMGSHLVADDNRIWLDPLDLARGRLSRIAMGTHKTVHQDGLVGMAYGKLADHLEASHHVIRHDYDWRQPIRRLGADLAGVLRTALQTHPDQPVRILAHSMGGLVVRAAFAADQTLWPDIVARPGGRLLMLGTPNHGSHLFVETLLGQSETVRMLARLDLKNGMQAVLDIIAGFPGAVHLLPAPGFEDTAGLADKDYYRAEVWTELAAINNDFWFGRQLAGKPTQAMLDEATAFWRELADTRWVDLAPERVAYVFGKADNTPCGILLQTEDGKPKNIIMRGTPDGDGSVTWKSGRIPNLPDERCWAMPVDHMGLTSTGKYFADITAMLDKGMPIRLDRLAVSRGEDAQAPLISYRAGPPPAYPSDAEIACLALGGRLRPLPKRKRSTLAVAVRAMDLRFVQVPILCGHYKGDPIAGAEGAIDRWLVEGALSQRQRLGIHSGELGNATVVLMPRRHEESLRRTGRGAVVVGLGEMGRLGAEGVSEAVRAGALRYLLHACDREGEEHCSAASDSVLPLRLASLLIGTNSAARLEVGDAVRAIVRGVLLANRDFALGSGARKAPRGRVVALELIELYRDTAISAAYAVRALDQTLATELAQLDAELELSNELQYGNGVRQRLSATPFSDYWPRLAVSDADRDDSDCSPECWTPRLHNPIPPQALRQLLTLYGAGNASATLPLAQGFDSPPLVRYAERLRFTYMGEKARAEAILQQRQPGLIEKLAAEALSGPSATRYAPGEQALGHMLFQLLVPVEFKATARKANNLILVVDENTANLPWELLEADAKPLVRTTRMVRQFMTSRFRREIIRTDALSACVIANPSTEGYHAQFGGAGWKPRLDADGKPRPDRLPSLDGAAREGEAVVRILEGAGYNVSHAPPDALAGDVFSRLFARPCRILVVAAHGIYAKRGADGHYRSGVVLSDGLLLSAAEIGLMEIVPDLVFLSCCHLGKIGTGEGDQRLAASLARELIDMGVRCVVAAGWEVRDDAALSFSETFFNQMAVRGARFADAVLLARQATLDAHPDCNTWGAYQAYGDPAFQLRLNAGAPPDDAPLLAPEELLDWLEQLLLNTRLPDAGKGELDFDALDKRIRRRLGRQPAHWAERTDVLQALGRLYAEFGRVGFDAARMALLRAIAEDSSQGLVPISAIEQLINMEARQAERLSTPDTGQDLAAASVMIDDALARAAALSALAGLHPAGDDEETAGIVVGAARPNTERQSIIGSAWKKKALILLRHQAPKKEAVIEALQRARDAYARGEADPRAADWNPYARINRMQLDAVLGDAPEGEADATRCIEAARARFKRRFDFWDAVMAADATVAGWLAGAALPGGGTASEALIQTYRDTLDTVTASPRELDSVFVQLGLLADVLRLQGGKTATAKEKVLREVIKALKSKA